jgi:hypothetical protein
VTPPPDPGGVRPAILLRREVVVKKLIAAVCLLTGTCWLLFFPPRPAAAKNGPEPDRERRLAWWREARFGMMISWGLYAVPAGVWKNKTHPDNYAEWIMFDEKIPVKEYERLAGEFDPVKFDARAWANTTTASACTSRP